MEFLTFYITFIFFLGLAFGSFLNVVICRVPENKSIISPPSHCPLCKHKLAVWENIPIVSYIILLGKCRECRAHISIQYPLVELFTGISFAIVAWRFQFTVSALVFIIFTAILIALSVIDFKTRLLPDVITLPTGIAAILLSFATLHPAVAPHWGISPLEALAGILAGAGPLALIAFLYYKITGRQGLGMGDIKLMILVGALLGPWNAFLTLFIGAITGTVAGLPTVMFNKEGRNTEIPFGPFLSGGAWIAALWGLDMFNWYMNVSGLSTL